MFKKISVQDVQYIEFFNHYGIENQSACGGLQQSFDVCLFLFLVDYDLEVDVQNKLLQNYSAL